MNQSVGIGEHSDIVEAIQEELDKMAAAEDRLEMIGQIEWECGHEPND